MSDRFYNFQQYMRDDVFQRNQNEFVDMSDDLVNDGRTDDIISEGASLEAIVDISSQPPHMNHMENIHDENCIFMISPFKYDPLYPKREPAAIYQQQGYVDRFDADHVRMPCSPGYLSQTGQPIWPIIQQSLNHLQNMCENETATVHDLIGTIQRCSGSQYEMNCLEILISDRYTNEERHHFMFTTLPNICFLALNVDLICSQPPPLLRTGIDRSVTMSQAQAASLLACAFFCLFPFRSDYKQNGALQYFPNPNFNKLYKSGPPQKIEKLKCILHYFDRITESMPNGVISFQRFSLPVDSYPKWSNSKEGLCDMHLTTGKKIEDISGVLQADFANKYIGGGVLTSGCVQEEIRFAICPEMLVSLLVCERMEPNECIYLIGCERYSLYKNYAASFEFGGDYKDATPKDNWGQKWCHVVAMDALYFRHPSGQYDMKCVDRELIKAYTSFRPRKTKNTADIFSGVVTGNWGCGAFNGDRQLKAIIQLMAASEAERPLIYAAYRDKNLVKSFSKVYDYLKEQQATVGDLYLYLRQYSTQHSRSSLFDYILKTPMASVKS